MSNFYINYTNVLSFTVFNSSTEIVLQCNKNVSEVHLSLFNKHLANDIFMCHEYSEKFCCTDINLIVNWQKMKKIWHLFTALADQARNNTSPAFAEFHGCYFILPAVTFIPQFLFQFYDGIFLQLRFHLTDRGVFPAGT